MWMMRVKVLHRQATGSQEVGIRFHRSAVKQDLLLVKLVLPEEQMFFNDIYLCRIAKRFNVTEQLVRKNEVCLHWSLITMNWHDGFERIDLFIHWFVEIRTKAVTDCMGPASGSLRIIVASHTCAGDYGAAESQWFVKTRTKATKQGSPLIRIDNIKRLQRCLICQALSRRRCRWYLR